MKVWECSACGGKSFTRLNASTIMCDYCETRFTLEESERGSTEPGGSAELRRAKVAALLVQADALHNEQKYQEEVSLLLQALEVDEQNADVWNKLGRAYRLLGMYDDALRCYERALRLDPENAAAYGNIGVVCQVKGDYISAVRNLKRGLLKCDPSSGDYAIMTANLAIAMYKGGNHAEGIRLIDEAERLGYANANAARQQMGIAVAPTPQQKQQAASLKQEAQTLYQKAEYAKAVSILQRVVQLDNTDSDAWNQLGRVHRLTSNPDEAMRCYQRALKLDPNNGAAYGNIGVLYHNQGDYAKAIEHYRKALRMLPANAAERSTMTANLAMSTYLSGDRKNGERLLNEAEKLGYRNGEAARKMLGIPVKKGLFGIFK